MKTEIMIVSYAKDKPWLEFNLRSIRKFCSGFAGVTLLVPEQEKEDFADVVTEHNGHLGCFCPALIMETYNRDYPETHWHLGHQVEKCFADIHCPHADFILHTDSDCIFTEPVTPEDYFIDEKPVLLCKEYDSSNSHWRAVTDSVMLRQGVFSCMMRHPAVHYRDLYLDLREHIGRVHDKPFTDYVMALKPSFPWGYSEFSALGQMATNGKWKSKYALVHERPHDKLLDFWCHAPLNEVHPADRYGYFPQFRGCTPRQVFERLGL